MTKKTDSPHHNSDPSTWETAKQKLGDALHQWNDIDQKLDNPDAVDSPDEKQRKKRYKLLKELEAKIKELSK